jgi:meiotically up-regulated gene 157 (Mug157) protein
MHDPLPIPPSMARLMDAVDARLADRPQLAALFRNCFPNTLSTTMRPQPDGTTFVITGDIPAMWLRDSAAQVRPYLILAADDTSFADLIEGVVRRQLRSILLDPYANAFNERDDGRGHQDDLTEMSPWVWERKYEIDSLCYPLQLAYLLWRATGRTAHFDDTFRAAASEILALWRREQRHGPASPYRFTRLNCPPGDTLHYDGLGSPVVETGMTWSGFRPSDDACSYGYLVPANMFAVAALGQLAQIAEGVLGDTALAEQARQLAQEIDAGIRTHAVVEHPAYGRIYAYETDGMGRYNLMDDANVPSLLSMPYLGYCSADEPVYLNTRRFILSAENPFYFQGQAAAGIGSPHTPHGYIWHIALAMQGLTANERDEQERVLALLESTDAGTGYMHEGFSVDDPGQFTRPWFAWANSLFSELVLAYCGFQVPGSPLSDHRRDAEAQRM